MTQSNNHQIALPWYQLGDCLRTDEWVVLRLLSCYEVRDSNRNVDTYLTTSVSINQTARKCCIGLCPFFSNFEYCDSDNPAWKSLISHLPISQHYGRYHRRQLQNSTERFWPDYRDHPRTRHDYKWRPHHCWSPVLTKKTKRHTLYPVLHREDPTPKPPIASPHMAPLFRNANISK